MATVKANSISEIGLLKDLTGTAIIDESLSDFLNLFFRDFILSWFTLLSDDPTLVLMVLNNELKTAIDGIKYRLAMVDYVQLLMFDIPVILLRHVKDYKTSREMEGTVCGGGLSADEIFALRQPHFALQSIQTEEEYIRQIIEGIIQYLLNQHHSECSKFLLREILTSLTVEFVDKLCDGDFINEIILSILLDNSDSCSNTFRTTKESRDLEIVKGIYNIRNRTKGGIKSPEILPPSLPENLIDSPRARSNATLVSRRMSKKLLSGMTKNDNKLPKLGGKDDIVKVNPLDVLLNPPSPPDEIPKKSKNFYRNFLDIISFLKSLPSQFGPINANKYGNVDGPWLLFIAEIFSLATNCFWVWTYFIGIIRPLIIFFSPQTITRLCCFSVYSLLNPTAISSYFVSLKKALWKKDIWNVQSQQKTQGQRHLTKQTTLNELKKSVPSLIKSILGELVVEEGIESFIEILQNESTNRRLLYNLLDLIVLNIIPEMRE